MKSFSSLVALLLSVASLASPAVAQQEVPHSRNFAQGRSSGEIPRPLVRRVEQKAGSSEQQIPRDAPSAPQLAEPKPVPESGLTPVQVRERLSPEERRQLRRDINAAGRDIYRRSKPE